MSTSPLTGSLLKITALYLLICSNGHGCVLATYSAASSPVQHRSFRVDTHKHVLLKDGKPFQYISGSLHYNRIPPNYWMDRLEKAKAAGLDAVQFYIPWNFHSPEEDTYNFEKDRDVEKFIQLIAQLDLLAIVRVGPYICAEWSFGGLPPWLLRKNPLMNIRSSDPEYFNHVVHWFEVLLPKLKRHLYVNGGPIIMIQLENEYGSYPLCDALYINGLHKLVRRHLGEDVVLFTTDGASLYLLRCGSPDPGLLPTIDFGPSKLLPNISFSTLQQFNSSIPWINSEFYTGWFDSWGDKHFKGDAKFLVSKLIELMRFSPRISVNMYMFHGGTNFGFWNGNGLHGAVTTSYDYDAPISEAGDVTIKYEWLRNAIYQFKNMTPPPLPRNTTKHSYGSVRMKQISHFICSVDHTESVEKPVNMEAKAQYEGLGLYVGVMPNSTRRGNVNVTFGRFADIAHIYTSTSDINSLEWRATLGRNNSQVVLNMEEFANHTLLIVVIENTGYKNFGDKMMNYIKGLFGDVMIGGSAWSKVIMGSIKRPLRISRECKRSKDASSDWPIQGGIFIGDFTIHEADGVHDTFVQMRDFSRGLVEINGELLGRYDQPLGPQRRLFIPRDFLRVGYNRILVGEFHSTTGKYPEISFHSEQQWNS